MIFRKVMIILLLLACSGCKDMLRKEPPPPPPTGPQSKEEVLAAVNPIIAPLRTTISGGPVISETERYTMMTGLRDAIMQYGSTEFGRQAFRDLAYEVQDIAKQASAIEKYRLVLICVDVTELLSVESHLLKRLGQKADVMLDKPKVQVKGFIDDIEKKQTYIFIEIINHRKGTLERMEAREGDEFNDLRVVRILGRNQAVLFEYLKLPGLFFEVEAF
ncbi:MAG: hypothetical protein GXY07_01190 [Candidatus Hydrogenedentes bacterium]|nr:hypothetical protein [Candidatus Hydrogenedentota bacterium]